MRKGLLNNDGTQFYYRVNGRFSVISLWNEDDERWIGAVRRGSAAVNLRTVSYTHLDVYKRQVRKRKIRRFADFLFTSLFSAFVP